MFDSSDAVPQPPLKFVCADGTELSIELRFSSKAKHRRLQLNHSGKLEVVFPQREEKLLRSGRTASQLQPVGGDGQPASASSHPANGQPAGGGNQPPNPVQAFIEQHRRWIERAAARTRQQRLAYQESLAAGLPSHLDFPLCEEIWLLDYRQTAASSITIKPDGLRRLDGSRQVLALKLTGAVDDERFCRQALIRFVTKRAKAVIPGFAWEVCREVGARPNNITVNNRKSAWGVCTHAGDIRIDRKVLFFPRDLARQVVLHEIAHLKQLNHSQLFYDELFSYPGSTKEAEKAVKQGSRFVPAWFLEG